jgi:hypothetical protein
VCCHTCPPGSPCSRWRPPWTSTGRRHTACTTLRNIHRHRHARTRALLQRSRAARAVHSQKMLALLLHMAGGRSIVIHTHTHTSRPIPAGAVENWPATQSLHDIAPAAAYRPDAHMAAGGLADVDAAGHVYPAAHTAVHVDTDKPCVLPYWPAGQSVQPLATAVDEYRPTAHSVHDPAQHTPAQTRTDKGIAAVLTCCPSSAFAKDAGAPPAHGGGSQHYHTRTHTLHGTYLLVPSRTGPPHSHCTTSPRPLHTDPMHTWRQEGSPMWMPRGTRTPRRTRLCTLSLTSPVCCRTGPQDSPCSCWRPPWTSTGRRHTACTTLHSHETSMAGRVPGKFINKEGDVSCQKRQIVALGY